MPSKSKSHVSRSPAISRPLSSANVNRPEGGKRAPTSQRTSCAARSTTPPRPWRHFMAPTASSARRSGALSAHHSVRHSVSPAACEPQSRGMSPQADADNAEAGDRLDAAWAASPPMAGRPTATPADQIALEAAGAVVKTPELTSPKRPTAPMSQYTPVRTPAMHSHSPASARGSPQRPQLLDSLPRPVRRYASLYEKGGSESPAPTLSPHDTPGSARQAEKRAGRRASSSVKESPARYAAAFEAAVAAELHRCSIGKTVSASPAPAAPLLSASPLPDEACHGPVEISAGTPIGTPVAATGACAEVQTDDTPFLEYARRRLHPSLGAKRSRSPAADEPSS